MSGLMGEGCAAEEGKAVIGGRRAGIGIDAGQHDAVQARLEITDGVGCGGGAVARFLKDDAVGLAAAHNVLSGITDQRIGPGAAFARVGSGRT